MQTKSTKRSKLAQFHGIRKHIRFDPDPFTLAWVSLKQNSKAFRPQIMGIVVSESYWGCGVVTAHVEPLLVGQTCKVAVGKADPIEAEVRWVKKLDENIVSFGLQMKVGSL